MSPEIAHQPAPLDDHLCFSIYSTGIAIQRLYKPILDELGLTYPQYLVLSVLWRKDEQPVGVIAKSLALESSTLTPLLKRLEASGLVRRQRSTHNERQVLVSLTEEGAALRGRVSALGDALRTSSGRTAQDLARLNGDIRHLRSRIYAELGGWDDPI